MVTQKIIVLLFVSVFAMAQDKVDVKGGIEADTTVITRTSRQLRFTKPVNIGASWDLFTTWMPSKLGVSASYNYSESKTISAEYQYASIKFPAFALDLGEIREEKYGIVLKSFGDSNSFYVSYGLMKYTFRAGLEAKLFPVSVPIAQLFDFSSIGFQFGLGHQWTWDNGISFGVDWFSLYYHAFNKNKNTVIFDYMSADDRDKADKMVDLIYNIPIIELLKLNLSYGF